MKRAENNSARINNYIIHKALEDISTDNKEEFIKYLESQGYKLTKETAEFSDNNTLSRAEAFTIDRQSNKVLLRFKEIIKKKMETINNMPESYQNNNVTRDELAEILNKLFINNNNTNQDNYKNNNNNVRIPTPPSYDGTRAASTIENWYIAVERYLRFNNFDESRWIDYCVILLTGRAQLWYSRITRNNSNYFNTRTAFKTALDTEFKPQFAARSARDRLFEVKQTHSIQQYIHNFQDILLEVSITDDEAIDKFIRGLKDRARAHVLMQDPVDLEAAYQCATAYESANMYGQHARVLNTTLPNNDYIDDPMDTSLNMMQMLKQQNMELLNVLQRQNTNNNSNNYRNAPPRDNNNMRREVILCFVCDKPGHFARDCYHRLANRNNNNNTRNNYSNNSRNPRNNYRSNNIRNRTSYSFKNDNHNNSKQSFNAIIDQYDPLYNNNNNEHINSFSSDFNKDLIDLAPSGSSDRNHYPPVPTTDPAYYIISPSDLIFLNNLQNASPELPLYKAMVGGSDFKILIDSGASTCYVHPKLISHAFKTIDISNQAVETADGNKCNINKKVSFKMYLGDDHEHEETINAFVFESKFDIILGRTWLKTRAPKPNWFDDTWEIQNLNKGNIMLYPIKNNNNLIIHNNQNSLTLSEDIPINISQQLFTTHPTYTRNTDTKMNDSVDYLLSANQVSRLLKKDEVEECYMLYFMNDKTGNSVLVSPTDAEAVDLKTDAVWKEEFAKLYPYAFKGEITELPPHRFTRDIIQTDPPNAPPIYHQPYQMSPIELQELQRILSDLEKKGLIVPTTSPYGFPILFIRHKTSGKLRMCCDFRSLNKISVSQRTPIPRIDECLNQLHGSRYYSQIDLTGAFNQTRLSDADSAKCVISHRYGQHRFLVTPFGLKNSGAYFQGIINATLKPYIDKFCLVYLDDILIYSKTEKEHKTHVNIILKTLNEAKFVINIDKSHFNIKELTFLGFQISKHGILPSKHKTEAIRLWPIPTNVQQVRQFLGLAQHFRRFIPDFAGIASVITDSTAGTGYKTRAIDWTPACQIAFDTIKDKLCSAPVLSTVDMDSVINSIKLK